MELGGGLRNKYGWNTVEILKAKSEICMHLRIPARFKGVFSESKNFKL